jgi:hypothetical protein
MQCQRGKSAFCGKFTAFLRCDGEALLITTVTIIDGSGAPGTCARAGRLP